MLLDALGTCSLATGWNTWNEIFQVSLPPTQLNPRPQLNLLNNYGELSLKQIRTHETNYIALPDRRAQETNLLFHCLQNSLSNKASAKINLWKEQYTIQGFDSGLLLLKVIIQESSIDTTATISATRTKLSNLHPALPNLKHSILDFNDYVKSLVANLTARGERSTDLLNNLFKGYEACFDNNFIKFIKRKKELYKECSPLTADKLMILARNKYDSLIEQGKWNTPSEQDTKILALKSKIKEMKKEKSATDPKTHKGGYQGGNRNHRNFRRGQNCQQQHNRNGHQNNRGNNCNNRRIPIWLRNNTPPPENYKYKEQTTGGRTLYWCGKLTGGR